MAFQDHPQFCIPQMGQNRYWLILRESSKSESQLCVGDGSHVLHFQPLRYDCWSQSLEITTGELIPGQPPLLKSRQQLSRKEAIQLWHKKRQAGWRVCEPQWSPPPPPLEPLAPPRRPVLPWP